MWDLQANAGLVIADFEMLGVYGVVMSIDDQVHNVFVGQSGSPYRLRYNKDTEQFELIALSDVRSLFINTTGSTLVQGTGVVLAEIPSESDIGYRAVPAE